MQLKDRDGIACDICGTSYRTDFRYYSFDIRNIAVNNNLRPPISSILSSFASSDTSHPDKWDIISVSFTEEIRPHTIWFVIKIRTNFEHA